MLRLVEHAEQDWIVETDSARLHHLNLLTRSVWLCWRAQAVQSAVEEDEACCWPTCRVLVPAPGGSMAMPAWQGSYGTLVCMSCTVVCSVLAAEMHRVSEWLGCQAPAGCEAVPVAALMLVWGTQLAQVMRLGESAAHWPLQQLHDLHCVVTMIVMECRLLRLHLSGTEQQLAQLYDHLLESVGSAD